MGSLARRQLIFDGVDEKSAGEEGQDDGGGRDREGGECAQGPSKEDGAGQKPPPRGAIDVPVVSPHDGVDADEVNGHGDAVDGQAPRCLLFAVEQQCADDNEKLWLPPDREQFAVPPIECCRRRYSWSPTTKAMN